VIGRALALALRGYRELVLENLALRQQLTAVQRATKRPHLQTHDRLSWMALARNWRTAVVLVHPDAVVRWHREPRRWIFLTVPTLTRRVLFVLVLVLLSHRHRCIVHLNITDHPTATWSAQQVVDAFPMTRHLAGCTEIATASMATSSNADWPHGHRRRRLSASTPVARILTSKRVIGSIRRECLDHVSSSTPRTSGASSQPTAGTIIGVKRNLGLEKDTPDHRPIAEHSRG
jgi:hypothetical protein